MLNTYIISSLFFSQRWKLRA